MDGARAVDVAGVVGEFASRLRRSGWRGLIALHGRDLGGLVAEAWEGLRGAVEGASCILVAPRSVEAPRGCQALGPGSLERLLGREADYVVVATPGLLRPNLLAAAAGAPRRGGALVLAAPPPGEWEPGPPGGAGGWKRYLLQGIASMEPLLWLDASAGRLLAHRPPRGRAPPPPARPRLRGPLKPLEGLAATRGQGEALEAGLRLLRGGARSLLVLGDRGRGKSFLLGLLAAVAARLGAASEAAVVSPDPCQLESFWRGLTLGLERLGLRFRVERRGGCIVSLSVGGWFRARYEAPAETLLGAPLLVVDEAAAVGVARLRRLAWRSGRILAATTVHGYEGGGLALAHMVEELLPRPMLRVELREPIRYPPGDPLEEWAYRLLILRPEPSWSPGAPRLEPRLLSGAELASSPELVRSVYRLLAAAHYRTEPDYLLTLLDGGERHRLLVLDAPGGPAAAAHLASEEPGAPEPERLSLRLLELGGAPPGGARALRIVRIAVHPRLQRRGLGRLLAAEAARLAIIEGYDLVAAVFGRSESLGFWLRVGFTPYYVSPRFNRATGEKNIAVARPLTPRGRRLLREAAARQRLRLIEGGHLVYRDLPAETIAALLDSMPTAEAPPPLHLLAEEHRLQLYLQGAVEHEQVIDLVRPLTAWLLSVEKPYRLATPPCATAAVAHIVQGKPFHEAARLAGGEEEAARCIRRLTRLALERIGRG